MKIVDTHVHVWDLSRFDYSWTKEVPALDRSLGIDEYREAVREVDISKAVLVEADIDESFLLEETRYLLCLAEQSEVVRGVVAGARPEQAGFAKYLENIAGHPKLRGLRRVLHSQPDDLVQSPGFVENIRRLEQYDLSYDICVLARQFSSAIHLVKQCPGVLFILDHCGCPDATSPSLDPWRAQVEEIAKYQNVACKVSGLVGYAGHDAWNLEDIRPCVEHVVDCFGCDRIMFGSDWPVCTLSTSPKEWVESVSSLIRAEGEGNHVKVFSRNAERFYRL